MPVQPGRSRSSYCQYTELNKQTGSLSGWKNYTNNTRESGGSSRTRPTPGIHHRVRGVWLSLPYTRTVTYTKQTSPGSHITDTMYGSKGGFIRTYRDVPIQTSFFTIADSFGIGNANYTKVFNDLTPRVRLEVCLAMKEANRSNAKRSDATPSVHVGNALAESRQTVGMITDRAETLGRLISYMVQGKWKKVAKTLGSRPKSGSRAGLWLEYAYGWRPLMDDIFNGFQLLKQNFAERDQTLSVTRSLASDLSIVTQWPTSTDKVETVTQVTLRSRATLIARVSNARLHALASMGLINPAEVLWERVPFSFVVDWFIPVGDMISALTASAGLEFVDGSTTESVVFGYTGPAPGVKPGGGTTLSWSNPTGEYGGVSMKRYVDTGWYLPAVYLVTNPFKSNMRKANAIALTAQRLRQRR